MSIFGIIWLIFVGFFSLWFPHAIWKSTEVTDKDIEKAFENFPDKIIINIKHEKESDDENEDRDCKNIPINHRHILDDKNIPISHRRILDDKNIPISHWCTLDDKNIPISHWRSL